MCSPDLTGCVLCLLIRASNYLTRHFFHVNILFLLFYLFVFLQELNLSFCEITEEAALIVAQAVKDKEQLEKLDLNGNILFSPHTCMLLSLLVQSRLLLRLV